MRALNFNRKTVDGEKYERQTLKTFGEILFINKLTKRKANSDKIVNLT